MRIRVLTAAALLAAITQVAAGAEPWNAADNPPERAVMFYFSKAIGSDARGRALPLSYGLRLQQSLSFAPSARVDLFDLGLNDHPRVRLLNGALQLNAFGKGKDADGKSSSEESSEDPTESSEE